MSPRSKALYCSASVVALAVSLGFIPSKKAEAICLSFGGGLGTPFDDNVGCTSLGGPDVGIDFLAGNDSLNMVSGLITGSFLGNTGVDSLRITGGTIQGNVHAGSGASTETDDGDSSFVSGGRIQFLSTVTIGSVVGDNGTDFIAISGGLIDGSVVGNGDNDTVTFSGGTIGDAITGGDGNDRIFITNGTAPVVNGEAGRDSIQITNGVWGNPGGGADIDTNIVSGGSAASVFAGSENDSIRFEYVPAEGAARYQPKSLPSGTGDPGVFRGSTTGPSYTQAV